MLIDTHCHLDFERFADDLEAVVARAEAAGVQRIVVPAIDLDNCPAVLALAERFTAVYAAVGVHPNSTAGWQDAWLTKLRAWAAHEKVVAIGEIGLDYYWDKAPKAIQQHALRQQMVLAAELNLPVILHNRESSDDLIAMLKDAPQVGRDAPGVLHSFSAPWETAVAALDLGYCLGFTGPVTFKKASDLREIVAKVPLDRLLVETDAPFLTPHPYRGKRNEPAYVAYVAERIASVRQLAEAEVAAQTTANALRLFPNLSPA